MSSIVDQKENVRSKYIVGGVYIPGQNKFVHNAVSSPGVETWYYRSVYEPAEEGKVRVTLTRIINSAITGIVVEEPKTAIVDGEMIIPGNMQGQEAKYYSDAGVRLFNQ